VELRRSLGLAHTEAKDAPLAERIMLPALNVRGIQVGAVGEQAANVISSEARASFDFRLVPNQTPERVRELVNAHIARQGYFVTSDSVTMAMRLAHSKVARVRWSAGGYQASRASMEEPFARAVVRAVGDGIGKPPLLLPTMGGSGPLYLFEQVLHTPIITLRLQTSTTISTPQTRICAFRICGMGSKCLQDLSAELGRTGNDEATCSWSSSYRTSLRILE
jgi:acetylornithine deacetylase/succinyl-diaminopimelate desuccinylase-like protein